MSGVYYCVKSMTFYFILQLAFISSDACVVPISKTLELKEIKSTNSNF